MLLVNPAEKTITGFLVIFGLHRRPGGVAGYELVSHLATTVRGPGGPVPDRV